MPYIRSRGSNGSSSSPAVRLCSGDSATGLPSGPRSCSRSGPRMRSRIGSVPPSSSVRVRVDRPAADRVAAPVLALPAAAQMEDLVRPEVQPIVQRLAVRAGEIAGEARRQPEAVGADRRRRLARLGRGVTDLDHLDLHLVRRAMRQHPVHGVRDEDQAAADRDLGAHRVGLVGRDLGRVEIDFEGERRNTRILDRRAAELLGRRVGEAHVLEHRLEDGARREGDSLTSSSRCR